MDLEAEDCAGVAKCVIAAHDGDHRPDSLNGVGDPVVERSGELVPQDVVPYVGRCAGEQRRDMRVGTGGVLHFVPDLVGVDRLRGIAELSGKS